jgi:hypothetical protein
MSPRFRARLRSWLKIEPFPDLAVRHPLFQTPEYRALRAAARAFDAPAPHKPVLERGHQTAYLVSRWLSEAGVQRAFHIGYASGRYLFYLARLGVQAGGVDLPGDQTDWARIPDGLLDGPTRARLVAADFLDMTPEQLRSAWGEAGLPVDVAFSEATFETLLPWRPRERGVSVAKYRAMEPNEVARLAAEALPARLAALSPWIGSYVFIEPEPEAGGAGALFERCAERLPAFRYGVWTFRPPLDSLFRLSPHLSTRQTIYALTRDDRLTATLRPYAEPL